TSASRSAPRVTSATTARTGRPDSVESARAASSSSSACRLQRTRSAPASASARAIANPSPRLPPVTRATRPFNRNASSATFLVLPVLLRHPPGRRVAAVEVDAIAEAQRAARGKGERLVEGGGGGDGHIVPVREGGRVARVAGVVEDRHAAQGVADVAREVDPARVTAVGEAVRLLLRIYDRAAAVEGGEVDQASVAARVVLLLRIQAHRVRNPARQDLVLGLLQRHRPGDPRFQDDLEVDGAAVGGPVGNDDRPRLADQ